MSQQESLLDDNSIFNTIGVPITPPTVVYPSWELRIGAGAIDILLLFFLTLVLALVLPWNERTLIGGCCTLLLPSYKIIGDVFWGATLGKRLLGLQIVQNKQDFPPISWGQALLRAVPFLPFTYDFIIYLWLQSLQNKHQNDWVLTIYNAYLFNNSIELLWIGFFAITLLPIFITKKCKTLYDLWSGTVCIQQKSASLKKF
ncbi:MAG: RDD family protein [Aureispira sp.]